MKKKYILKGLLVTIFLTFIFSSCDGYDVELIDSIGASREFSPTGLTVRVRNQTTVELNWTVSENADYYIMEISADDPEFNTIFRTIEVALDELPLQVTLEGETVYSIRIKAISLTGLEDSKWSIVTATTLSEQLFEASQDGDIQAKQATFRWVPNSSVTQIVVNPGEIIHVITAEEKANGIATVTGLTGEKEYTAILYNNAKKRGSSTFTTGIDIGTGILVQAEDDLNAKIAEAEAGAVLVLMPGDYTVFKGTISLNKSISIRGLYNYDKPLLHVNFLLNAGASDVNLIDLDLNGDKTLTDVLRFNTTSTNYDSLLISGCNIHDFDRTFIGGSVSNSKVTSIIVDNCIVTNIITSGGDFIDFRTTYVAEFTLKNSTFDNCSVGRDFVRIDAASGLSGSGLTTNLLVDGCTLYNNNSTSSNRILYVRFNANVLTVRNTLFAETAAIYSNQTTTSNPIFSNNNYFNSPSLFDETKVKFDNSGTYTALDPQFENVLTGDFTIKNQTLLDNKVGDPRWLK